MNITEIIGITLSAMVIVGLWAICAIGSKAEQEEKKIIKREIQRRKKNG